MKANATVVGDAFFDLVGRRWRVDVVELIVVGVAVAGQTLRAGLGIGKGHNLQVVIAAIFQIQEMLLTRRVIPLSYKDATSHLNRRNLLF